MGSSSFFSHNIFLLPCMACCRGNRPENGLAFPALPGESTHADMQLTTTCCMTGSGIFSPKCHQESPTTWCCGIFLYENHIKGTIHDIMFSCSVWLWTHRTERCVWRCCFELLIKKIKPGDGNVYAATVSFQICADWCLEHYCVSPAEDSSCVYVYVCMCRSVCEQWMCVSVCVCVYMYICTCMWVMSPIMAIKHFSLLHSILQQANTGSIHELLPVHFIQLV